MVEGQSSLRMYILHKSSCFYTHMRICFTDFFRERGSGSGEGEKEKHLCMREMSIGCLSHVRSNWESNTLFSVHGMTLQSTKPYWLEQTVIFKRVFEKGKRIYALTLRSYPGISNMKEFSKPATRVNKNQVHLHNHHKNYVLSAFLIKPNITQN